MDIVDEIFLLETNLVIKYLLLTKKKNFGLMMEKKIWRIPHTFPKTFGSTG